MWWVVLGLIAGMWALPAQVRAQAACTHYASNTGGDTSCTAGSPCSVYRFWTFATPGTVLCLYDGTYTGFSYMIAPPAGLSGTAGNPITIRAINPGGVVIDAQHTGFAIYIAWHGGNPNDWFIVEDIDATHGKESTVQWSGGDGIFRRGMAWDGTDGQDDSNMISMVGYNSRAIDCAAWGMNSRKILDGAQGGDLLTGGFKRCWAEWNDFPEGTSHPTDAAQVGYGTTNQLWENVLLTVDVLGETSFNPEGAMGVQFHHDGRDPDIGGTKVLGSIAYMRPGSTPDGAPLFSGALSNMVWVDLVMFVAPAFTTIAPAYVFGSSQNCDNPEPCVNNVCYNCLAVHAGTPIYNEANSGTTFPGLYTGNGLAAATGGISPFVLLPGICYRYEDGVLTSTPLWPWPMEARIRAARATSGYRDTNVTAEIESMLGTIPAQCRSDSGPATPAEPNIAGAPVDPGKETGRYGGFKKTPQVCGKDMVGCAR